MLEPQSDKFAEALTFMTQQAKSYWGQVTRMVPDFLRETAGETGLAQFIRDYEARYGGFRARL